MFMYPAVIDSNTWLQYLQLLPPRDCFPIPWIWAGLGTGLAWPIECGRSVVQVLEPGFKRPGSFCLCPHGPLSWDYHVRKSAESTGGWEATWRPEAPQPTASTRCQTREWGHLGLFSPADPTKCSCTSKLRQNQQRSCPFNSQNLKKL